MPVLETYNGYPLWAYLPNFGAAVAFAVFFAIISVVHLFFMLRDKVWFCLPFVIGGIFEFVGYIGRALAYNLSGQLPPYIMQSILILLGPILFATSLYMTLSRVITSVAGARFSPIPTRWLTTIFVCGDTLSFLVQGSGAGFVVQGSMESSQLGERIILGGLILQIVIFALFCLVASIFHRRFRSNPQALAVATVPWETTLIMLYVTSVFVMMRNVFRVIEYVMGHRGYLLQHEWPVYVFDGMLMLVTMMAFLFQYPSKLGKYRKSSQ